MLLLPFEKPHIFNLMLIFLMGVMLICCAKKETTTNDIEKLYINRDFLTAETSIAKQFFQDSIVGDSSKMIDLLLLSSKIKFAQYKYPEALQLINRSLSLLQNHHDPPRYLENLKFKGDIYYELKDIPNCSQTFDSLLYHAVIANDPKNIAYAYNRIAICHLKNRQDSVAIYYNNKSDSITNTLNNVELKGHVHFVFGIEKFLNGQYDTAQIHFLKSKDFFEKVNNKLLVGYNYINLGACNNEIGQHQSALEFYQKALQLGLELEHSNQLMMTYYNIGSVYVSLGRKEEAKKNYLEALEYGKIHSNLIPHINSLLALGIIAKETDYPLAVKYFDESLSKSAMIPNGISFAVKASQGLAETHDKYQNYTLAKQQFLKTVSLVDQANNPFLQAEIYNQVGTYLAIHKQYDKANQFCSSSLQYARNIKNHRLIKDACYCLYKLNESKSDKTNALEYHKQYIAAKDSFDSTNKMMEIGIKHARIEYEKHKVKNDFEIKHLNNELQSKIRSKNILVYTTIGLISILILLFYFIKDISDKRKALSHLNDQIKSNSELIMDQKLRLEESNNKLENFAYYAAHDIEAPINKIRHRIDLLQKEFSKSSSSIVPMINETLHLADYDARKLQKMINSLLYFSKIDKHIGNTNQIDLNILVKDITETLQYDSPSIEIQFKILRLPSIQADEGLIRSLFQNLIKNAIKYKKENEIAVITISGTNNDGFYKFYVQDNGIGIHIDQIDNIFEPFKQLSKTKEGSGMGLAIVKKIIEHYNGKIWVISTEGIGSTFHFTLKL